MCRSRKCQSKRQRPPRPGMPGAAMGNEMRPEVARLKRLIWRVYAELPPGALPPRVEVRLEDVVAPGFRERLDRAFLESLSEPERVM